MIRERPLQGYGQGNWATVYPSHARVDDGRYANQAHNDWLQMFAEEASSHLSHCSGLPSRSLFLHGQASGA